ncbi:hypothetical protein G6L37_04500 [Agrobacterium rubi]|nr:hypothetical protein [Agrobacterium rubi]NTF24613.1 hypothetical protein [Agrobacterium rubi]
MKLDSDEWNTRLSRADKKIRHMLESAHGCGPFDGGCLIVAQALQAATGGELVVLVDRYDEALHAAIMKDGQLWDYDGPMFPEAFLHRYNNLVEEEKYLLVRHREFRDYDLMEAMENDALALRMSVLFRGVLPPELRTGDWQVPALKRPDLDWEGCEVAVPSPTQPSMV